VVALKRKLSVWGFRGGQGPTAQLLLFYLGDLFGKRRAPPRLIFEIDIGEFLPAAVGHDKALVLSAV
jgi:hypothetical protein